MLVEIVSRLYSIWSDLKWDQGGNAFSCARLNRRGQRSFEGARRSDKRKSCAILKKAMDNNAVNYKNNVTGTDSFRY
jgi:hypothetical protein